MNNKLGTMIDYYRKRNKLSLEALGKKIDKSPSAISRWISGERSPMVEDLIRLTDIFEVDIEMLLYGRKASRTRIYNMFDGCISAGQLESIEAVKNEDLLHIELPDDVMGRYAGDKNIIITRVNGESMNRSIPNGSLIAIKEVHALNLNDGDIVVYTDEGGFSMKRFYNDKENHRLIFRPDSNSPVFIDRIVDYDDTDELKIIGKVVVSIIHFD